MVMWHCVLRHHANLTFKHGIKAASFIPQLLQNSSQFGLCDFLSLRSDLISNTKNYKNKGISEAEALIQSSTQMQCRSILLNCQSVSLDWFIHLFNTCWWNCLDHTSSGAFCIQKLFNYIYMHVCVHVRARAHTLFFWHLCLMTTWNISATAWILYGLGTFN